MEIIALIIAAIFLLFKSNLTSLSGTSGVVNIPPQGYVVPPSGQEIAAQQQTFGVASSAVSTLTQLGTSLGSAIPVVGGVLQGLINTFAAASKQRAQQATSENAAVAQAVPGWDRAVAAIVNAYNAKQLTAGQVSTALDAVWAQYWGEVGPQIQPGRNACKSGTVVQNKSGPSYCGTSGYGAACCVGYDDLDNSNINMKYAVNQAANTGKPTPASILPVFASKYGGINRPGYTVTFVP